MLSDVIISPPWHSKKAIFAPRKPARVLKGIVANLVKSKNKLSTTDDPARFGQNIAAAQAIGQS